MKLRALVLAFAVLLVPFVASATFYYPSPGCYLTSMNGSWYFLLAYHSKMLLDENNLPAPRIAIWEPDMDESCSWEIPWTMVTYGSPGAIDVQAEFDYFKTAINNSWLGISFVENKWNYFQYRWPHSANTNQVEIYDRDNWPYPLTGSFPVYGYTTPQLYDSGPWYRIWWSTVQVVSDDRVVIPNGVTPREVLRHEIGHALLFGGDDVSFDGMYRYDAALRTTGLGAGELSMLRCVYSEMFPDACELNVEAHVRDFWVDDSLTATWSVLSDDRQSAFLIEGLAFGEWIAVGDTIQTAGREYSVVLPGSPLSRYRLLACSGAHSEVLGYASPGSRPLASAAPPPSSSPLDELLACKADYLASENAQSELGLRDGERLVVFGPEEMLSLVEAHMEALWVGVWGADVEYIAVDDLGPSAAAVRNSIDTLLSQRAAVGVANCVLIGSANDWERLDEGSWTGYWWPELRSDYVAAGVPAGGAPERDIVPTWFHDDGGQPSISMSRVTPYWYSDLEYSDTDGNGLPDLPVSRWPVANSGDLCAYMAKIYRYSQRPIVSPNVDARVHFLVGDDTYRTMVDDSGPARHVASNVRSQLPPYVRDWTLYMSEIDDLSLRNQIVANELNGVRPNVVLVYSNGSNQYSIGGFLDHPSWGMSALDATNESVYLAATCLTADFARTQPATSGRSTMEEFLFARDRGAVAWIGPTNATWQVGNARMIEAVTAALFIESSEPMARVFQEVQGALIGDGASNSHVAEVARSYGFFGDPLSPLRGGGYSPVGTPNTAPRARLALSVFPNPFNSRISVRLTGGDKLLTSVAVYDVRGALVRSLYSGNAAGDVIDLHWDGLDDSGRSCASGVYSVRATVGGESIAERVILAK